MIIETLFNRQNDDKNYKDILKLIKVILNNKGFKISNAVIIY